tara:strand:- start:5840 stop:6274 length:435 start_codon:yes stop_codon:yes gene_type:complete
MPKRQAELGKLRDPFYSAIKWMIFLIEKEGLPLTVFETYRGADRQNYLKEKGLSNAGASQSPHNYGLAADFILDTDKCDVRKREWPEGSGVFYPDAWDYDSKEGKHAFIRLGEIAKSLGLVWGGDWKSLKDYPHVEMPEWRKNI